MEFTITENDIKPFGSHAVAKAGDTFNQHKTLMARYKSRIHGGQDVEVYVSMLPAKCYVVETVADKPFALMTGFGLSSLKFTVSVAKAISNGDMALIL